MRQKITRRDFLNGAALTVAASLTPFEQLQAQVRALPRGHYPPALAGLRGSTDAAYAVIHGVAREGRRYDIDEVESLYVRSEVGHGIELAFGQQGFDQGISLGLPDWHRGLQAGQIGNLVHQRAGPVVQRRIGFEQQRRWPPWLFPGEVGQADPAPGNECLPVLQRRLDLGITRHAIAANDGKPDHRSGIAQRIVVRIGIGQRRLVERVEIEDRRCAHHQSSKIATARVQPADAPLILCGKHEIMNPVEGIASRLCIFSMWQ